MIPASLDNRLSLNQVDVNIFPGYKGFLDFHPIYYGYLRDQASVKAMEIDAAKLMDLVSMCTGGRNVF